jgi:hypothetical protein
VQNGYNVGGSGKLFHAGVPAYYDEPVSWTEECVRRSITVSY